MKSSISLSRSGPGGARARAMARAILLLCSIASLGALMAGAAARAQGPAGSADAAPALLSGADLAWRPYGAMRPALAAFTQEHALAPEAEARFLLRPPDGASLAGLRLELALDDETRIYLPVMADGTFSLPDHPAAPAQAALALNRPTAPWRWRPSVRSPDLPSGARRLGDLRLECRMLWALEQAAPAAQQPAWPGRAPCQGVAPADAGAASSALPVAFPAPRPLSGATLVAGARRGAVRLDAGGSLYYPPLADPSWSDDALLYFDFAAPAHAE